MVSKCLYIFYDPLVPDISGVFLRGSVDIPIDGSLVPDTNGVSLEAVSLCDYTYL